MRDEPPITQKEVAGSSSYNLIRHASTNEIVPITFSPARPLQAIELPYGLEEECLDTRQSLYINQDVSCMDVIPLWT